MSSIDLLRESFIDILSCLVKSMNLTKEDILGVVLLCNTKGKMKAMVDWLMLKIPESEDIQITITRNELWAKAVEIQRQKE